MKKNKVNKTKKSSTLSWLEKLNGKVLFKEKIETLNNLIEKVRKPKRKKAY